MLRFVLSGGIATLSHWLLMAVLLFAGSKPAAATSIGAGAGAIINYFAQKRYTFRSDALHRRTLPRYLAICLFLWVSNLVLFLLINGILISSIALTQMLTTLVVALLGYWSYKWVVFNDGD